MKVGDMAIVKIFAIAGKGVDVTKKERGLGKIEEGLIFKINPNKVPRIIGKEGSMIKLIRDKTGCDITAGQNGFIWILGDKIENELLAKKSVEFIAERSFVEGLTEKVEKFFSEEKK